MRLWRTVRHLALVQVAHRVRLRARAALRRRFPGTNGSAGPAPPPGDPYRAPIELLRPCSPEVVRRRAEAVAGGRFSFVGVTRDLGANPFPAPADAPLLFAYHLEYMDYLLDLVLSGREEVAQRLVEARIASDAVPRPSGAHPYTDARRTAALLRLLPLASPGLRSLAAGAAWRYANRLLRNLEWDVGGNHLLENGLALALAGAAFRGPRARLMRERGRRILWEAGPAQILPDGGHFELSAAYHARVLAVLLEGTLALEHCGIPAPGEVYDAMARMTSYLAGILDERGRLPLIGDSCREEDLEPGRLIDAASRLLPFAVEDPAPGDRAYPASGLYVFEDARSKSRLLFDAGETCPDRLPAHGQADTFTFELDVGGTGFVVDPGVFEYAAGEMRRYGRSTRSHSTVEVAGRDSSEVWSSFRVGRRARVKILYHEEARGRATLAASHDGYRHLGFEHRRLVAHLDRGLWLVGDRVRGRGPIDAASRLHLHPDVKIVEGGDGSLVLVRGENRLHVVPFGAVSRGFERGWHSPTFGERRETRVLVLRASGMRSRMGFVLAAGRDEPPVVDFSDAVRIEDSTRRFVRALP